MHYKSKITAKVFNVVAWRNDTIGNGTFKLEDDANYQKKMTILFFEFGKKCFDA